MSSTVSDESSASLAPVLKSSSMMSTFLCFVYPNVFAASMRTE
nr:hypothetical protein [Thermoplasma sp. Kam2015]